MARNADVVFDHKGTKVATPGGAGSPQRPGMTPDRSTIPGHFSERVAPNLGARRPMSQYGSAEEIMGVFYRADGSPLTPDEFEQADSSDEELRKHNPANLTPDRPARGYVLDAVTPVPAVTAGASEVSPGDVKTIAGNLPQ